MNSDNSISENQVPQTNTNMMDIITREEQYVAFMTAIENEVGCELPFEIALFDHTDIERGIQELNAEFSKEEIIMICDRRIHELETILGYVEPSPPQYTVIRRPCGQSYISIKDILYQLGTNTYYIYFEDTYGDYEINHIFLERIEKNTDSQYTLWFGS